MSILEDDEIVRIFLDAVGDDMKRGDPEDRETPDSLEKRHRLAGLRAVEARARDAALEGFAAGEVSTYRVEKHRDSLKAENDATGEELVKAFDFVTAMSLPELARCVVGKVTELEKQLEKTKEALGCAHDEIGRLRGEGEGYPETAEQTYGRVYEAKKGPTAPGKVDIMAHFAACGAIAAKSHKELTKAREEADRYRNGAMVLWSGLCTVANTDRHKFGGKSFEEIDDHMRLHAGAALDASGFGEYGPGGGPDGAYAFEDRIWQAAETNRHIAAVEARMFSAKRTSQRWRKAGLRAARATKIALEKQRELEDMAARSLQREISVKKDLKPREAAEVTRVLERILSFRELRDGWLNGEGVTPTPAAMTCAGELLASLLNRITWLEPPSIYPTPEGGVQAEWSLGGWAVNVTFEPDGRGVTAGATLINDPSP
jgi:hypothetical protein